MDIEDRRNVRFALVSQVEFGYDPGAYTYYTAPINIGMFLCDLN
jgi:hypothetical protein